MNDEHDTPWKTGLLGRPWRTLNVEGADYVALEDARREIRTLTEEIRTLRKQKAEQRAGLSVALEQLCDLLAQDLPEMLEPETDGEWVGQRLN